MLNLDIASFVFQQYKSRIIRLNLQTDSLHFLSTGDIYNKAMQTYLLLAIVFVKKHFQDNCSSLCPKENVCDVES